MKDEWLDLIVRFSPLTTNPCPFIFNLTFFKDLFVSFVSDFIRFIPINLHEATNSLNKITEAE